MPWTDAVLETDRLRLRAFRESDKPAIIALATGVDVRRYLGGPIAGEQLDAIRAATVGERWGVFCVAEPATDAAVGRVSFDRARGELEVSYELLPDRWGRGLATEAIGAGLGWAWDHTDEPAVIAVTQAANERSLRLLDRAGFAVVGEFEEFGALQRKLRLDRPAVDPI